MRSLIAKNVQIRALRRSNSDMSLVADIADQIEWFESDILDPIGLEDAFSGADRVYHCAAMISVVQSDWRRLMKVNVEGTANVVNAALKSGVKKLLYFSSVSALGRIQLSYAQDETFEWQEGKDKTAYSVSKFHAEKEAWRGFYEGLPTIIVSPSTNIGAGNFQKGAMSIISKLDAGLPFYPAGTNGYIHVKDSAEMSIALMNTEIEGEKFILSAENISYRDYFSAIARRIHVNPPSRQSNRILSAIGWRIEAIKSKLNGKSPFITKQSVQLAQIESKYDGSKVLKALNTSYRSISEALDEACAAYLAEKSKS